MMKINVEGIKMNERMYDLAAQAMKRAALAPHPYAGSWFDSEEDYEDWAGDVLDELFWAGCEALGIKFYFDDPNAPDAVFITEGEV